MSFIKILGDCLSHLIGNEPPRTIYRHSVLNYGANHNLLDWAVILLELPAENSMGKGRL